jgi:oligopeptide/dipeptide ABC transporter ATP-binding protein
MTAENPLIKVDGLKKFFPLSSGLFQKATSFIHAVDDVSFEIYSGESLALVGESGSGKTTTCKLLVRLLNPTDGQMLMNTDGEEGIDITTLRGKDLKRFRRDVQMIFQDPYESLNPRLTVFDAVSEPLAVLGLGDITERESRVAELLTLVGLAPPETFMFRFPHELSGGQRQRVAIARALVVTPSFVVADEPTSMLDVSIRTGIMKLLLDLAEQLNVTYLYITHDLAVARYLCHRIAVMYLGKIVEVAETEELLAHPQHPYTQALLASVPVPDPRLKREMANIVGGIAMPIDPPATCRFLDRCPLAAAVCRANNHPPLAARAGNHYVACHLA